MRTQLLSIVSIGAVLDLRRTRQPDERRSQIGSRPGHSPCPGSSWVHWLQRTRVRPQSEYSVGMGFYSAVWPLIDQPLADFQIGLASSWITPDNSDNTDKPLAPEGTLARTWPDAVPRRRAFFKPWKAGWATGQATTSAMVRQSSA